jgi:hypothetical protein
VESALVDHPAVAEAAVVGKAHDLKGQAIAAFVTLRTGFTASTSLRDELRDHVARRSGRSRGRTTSCSAPTCPRRAAARSCAACCATSPKDARWATPRRWPIRRRGGLKEQYEAFVASAGPPAATNSFVVTSAATAGQCTAAVTPTIAVGGEATVAVGDASCVLLGGPAVAGWRLTLATPQRLRFAATATAFAPVVAITNLAMEVLDAGLQFFPGTAEVARMMPAGEYLVWGGVLGAGSGNVTVSVEEAVPCTAAGVLPLPGSVNGALEVTDCPMEGYSSAFGDPWTLTLGAATTVEFNLTSATFDTYLELRTADDEYIASDDDGGTGTNSRLVRTLPAGTYRVWATSFYSSVTGSYTLSAAVTGGGLLAPPEGTSAPSAKPGRPPRSVPWPAPRADGTRRRE